MPYKITESNGQFWVVEADTGKKKNKKPYNSKQRALAYLRALEANMPKSEKHGGMHSAAEKDRLQAIHDHAASLGAECGAADMESKSFKSTGSVYMTCQMCIAECIDCIRQCQGCPSGGDAMHQACVKACQDCIVACSMCCRDCGGGVYTDEEPPTSAQCVQSCKDCAMACSACMEACKACTCPVCAEECQECYEACDECAEECNENAGVIEGAEHEAGEMEMGKHAKVPAQVKTTEAPKELNLSYAKSLGIQYPEMPELAVKFVGRDAIRGYTFLWGNPEKRDLDREYFLPETDFWDKTLGKSVRPLTWDHAQDEELKADPRIGEIVDFGDDEVGRWYEAKLDRAHRYRKAVDQLIKDGVLGTSSDSAPQYVVRQKTGKATWLKQWPWFASALTDVPCEPRMIGSIEILKAWGISLPEAGDDRSRQFEILTLREREARIRSHLGGS